jgi:hypothetical protein
MQGNAWQRPGGYAVAGSDDRLAGGGTVGRRGFLEKGYSSVHLRVTVWGCRRGGRHDSRPRDRGRLT